MQGYIKLYRKIIESEFYFSERFTKQQAWIDLLLLARHNSGLVTIRGIDIKLNPGQLCYSQLSLSKRWQWDRKKVKKFLNQLKKREMVDIKISKVTTIISIINWFSYQGVDNKKDNRIPNRIPNRFPTNNNDKNEKNEKNSINATELEKNSFDFIMIAEWNRKPELGREALFLEHLIKQINYDWELLRESFKASVIYNKKSLAYVAKVATNKYEKKIALEMENKGRKNLEEHERFKKEENKQFMPAGFLTDVVDKMKIDKKKVKKEKVRGLEERRREDAFRRALKQEQTNEKEYVN